MKSDRRYELPSLPQKETGEHVPLGDLFTLKTGQVDVAEMIRHSVAHFEQSKPVVREDLLKATAWEADSVLRKICEDNPDRIFQRLNGGIKFSKLPQADSPFYEFYQVVGHRTGREGSYENRGKSYYVAIDSRLDLDEKIRVMEGDIEQAWDCLAKVNGIKADEESSLYLVGALDYLKQHYLNLLHSVVFPEKVGIIDDSDEYKNVRQKAVILAKLATGNFYRAILGEHELDEDPSWREETNEIIQYLRKRGDMEQSLKIQEIDHPWLILLNAQQNVKYYPETETIVALASGGSQAAIATSLLLEKKTSRKTETVFLPVSLHAVKKFGGKSLDEDSLTGILSANKENYEDKNVLITEDNSNSGSTVTLVERSMKRTNPKSLHISFVELDPIRIVQKFDLNAPILGKVPEFVANYHHPDFRTAVNVLPMSRKHPDVQLRKIRIKTDILGIP